MEKISFAKRTAIEDAIRIALMESGTRVCAEEEAEGYPVSWIVKPGMRDDLRPTVAKAYAEETMKAAELAEILNGLSLAVEWKGVAIETSRRIGDMRDALFDAVRMPAIKEEAVKAALALAA